MRRFQVNILRCKHQELKRLGELLRIRTLKEVFNLAFTLLKMAVELREQGYRIISVKGDRVRDLVLPGLEFIEEKQG